MLHVGDKNQSVLHNLAKKQSMFHATHKEIMKMNESFQLREVNI